MRLLPLPPASLFELGRTRAGEDWNEGCRAPREELMSHRESARAGLDATGAREISLTIPVAQDMEIVATAQAAAVGEFIGMPRDKIDEVKLALVEACINAFEHSYTRDDQVRLTFR